MQNHEQIMNTYHLFLQELKRREEFKESIGLTLQEYEYYSVRNIVALEDKTEIIFKDSLVDVATKSMKKTDLYYFLEKENIERLIDLVEAQDFKYELYYIDNYNNFLRDIIGKFFIPNEKSEKLMAILIGKGIIFSQEKTHKLCNDMKTWYKNWTSFLDKQLLFYKLEERLDNKSKEKEEKSKITKI